jgi:hypothetical protein
MLELPNALYALVTQLPDEWLRIALTMLFMRHKLTPPCRLAHEPVEDCSPKSVLTLEWPRLEMDDAAVWHQLTVQCLSDGLIIRRYYAHDTQHIKLSLYEHEAGIDKLLVLLRERYKLRDADLSQNAWATMYETVQRCEDRQFVLRMTGSYCVIAMRRFMRHEWAHNKPETILGLLRLLTAERQDCREAIQEQCQCVLELCSKPDLMRQLWEAPRDADAPQGLLLPEKLYKSLVTLRELDCAMPTVVSV